MAADSIVRARIDSDTKDSANIALRAMGLSASDAIRMLMTRIAEEQRLPFNVEVPNTATREAMRELETGRGKHFNNTDELFDDLGI